MAEPDRRVGLRVDVDEQRRVAGLGDAGRHVDRRGGLAHPTLLVGDRVDRAHRGHGSDGHGRTRAPQWFARELCASGRGSKWPFAGHSRAPRVTVRGRTNLQVDVEVPVARVRERLHPADLGELEVELDRRRSPVRLLGRVAAPLPGDERPALPQQWRGVFDQDVQRRKRPRRDEIVRAEAVRPRLGTGVDRPRRSSAPWRRWRGPARRTCGPPISTSDDAGIRAARRRAPALGIPRPRPGRRSAARREPTGARAPLRLSATWTSSASARSRTVVGAVSSRSEQVEQALDGRGRLRGQPEAFHVKRS